MPEGVAYKLDQWRINAGYPIRSEAVRVLVRNALVCEYCARRVSCAQIYFNHDGRGLNMTFLKFAILACALGLSTTGTRGFAADKTTSNWPQFRGTNASGISEGSPTASTWNVEKGENVLSMASLANGVYFLNISSREGKPHAVKVVKD